jgi:pimeloyl-ACP methyl ester carboxylesterase
VPGSALADTAEASRTLMDHLGAERYLVAGWSSGGPHAMADAVVDPRRVRGVLLSGPFAPYDADGLDFLTDMGLMSVIQFRAAARSVEACRAVISQMAAAVREHDLAEVAPAMASLLPKADTTVLHGVYGVENAVSMRHGLAAGYAGWSDDLHALTGPWGFDPSTITAPVELWHGAMDRVVPLAHAKWPARHLPDVRFHVGDREGHLSIAVGSLGEKLDQLAARLG